MFQIGEAVYVNIPVNGQTIKVPGICNSDEYAGTRVNRSTGADIPTVWVDVITYHEISAEQAKRTPGQAFTYYKLQRQSAFFMDPRTEAVKELDDLDAEQLAQKLTESRAAIATRTFVNARGLNDPNKPSVKTKLTTPVMATA